MLRVHGCCPINAGDIAFEVANADRICAEGVSVVATILSSRNPTKRDLHCVRAHVTNRHEMCSSNTNITHKKDTPVAPVHLVSSTRMRVVWLVDAAVVGKVDGDVCAWRRRLVGNEKEAERDVEMYTGSLGRGER